MKALGQLVNEIAKTTGIMGQAQKSSEVSNRGSQKLVQEYLDRYNNAGVGYSTSDMALMADHDMDPHDNVIEYDPEQSAVAAKSSPGPATHRKRLFNRVSPTMQRFANYRGNVEEACRQHEQLEQESPAVFTILRGNIDTFTEENPEILQGNIMPTEDTQEKVETFLIAQEVLYKFETKMLTKAGHNDDFPKLFDENPEHASILSDVVHDPRSLLEPEDSPDLPNTDSLMPLNGTDASLPNDLNLVTMPQLRIDIPNSDIPRIVKYQLNVVKRMRNKLRKRYQEDDDSADSDNIQYYADELVLKSFSIAEHYAKGVPRMSDIQSTKKAHNELVRGINAYIIIDNSTPLFEDMDALKPLPEKINYYSQVQDVMLRRINDIENPSSAPTSVPTVPPSEPPTAQPTNEPSKPPTTQPSEQPSEQPTVHPSVQPSEQPSTQPSEQPTEHPSVKPTGHPTPQPSAPPSEQPTNQPSWPPTAQPMVVPSEQPSAHPSVRPTVDPTINTTDAPIDLSEGPTAAPTKAQIQNAINVIAPLTLGNGIVQPEYNQCPANLTYRQRLNYVESQLDILLGIGGDLRRDCLANSPSLNDESNQACIDALRVRDPMIWYRGAKLRIRDLKREFKDQEWSQAKIERKVHKFLEKEKETFRDETLRVSGWLENRKGWPFSFWSANYNMIDFLSTREFCYLPEFSEDADRRLFEEGFNSVKRRPHKKAKQQPERKQLEKLKRNFAKTMKWVKSENKKDKMDARKSAKKSPPTTPSTRQKRRKRNRTAQEIIGKLKQHLTADEIIRKLKQNGIVDPEKLKKLRQIMLDATTKKQDWTLVD